MEYEYQIIQFEDIPDDEYVLVEDLKKFIEDAEIVMTNYSEAYSKYCIKRVGDSHRGAILHLVTGGTTYGYNITSKLVKKVK